ncbi:hypothetical protein CCZ37_17915 [Vibrio qinghaiensis]|jgi:hypothetical protein|uniref:DUF3103 domain-containing protein n=1 Tax=Vibrio qinghaiensis TaxID=2025808 RepID=A0A223N354_9VIBR|nr:DUF3103 domain-containing protein [Vibrio qinghaiensis]ASU24322.1 hypothetical protein CCZ37_17915 [Vibrio qinghaiensis]
MRYITPVSLLLVATIMGCNSEEATTNSNSTSQSNADVIAQQKRALALQLSESYAKLETTLKTEINAQNLSISVSTLFEEQPDSDFSQQMVVADAQIRSMKGIEDFTEQLLQLRIADASMIKEWQEGQSPLFAFEPKGNDASWQYIEAFDVYGQVHQLDVYQMPDVPVFVVDSNSEVELRAGLQAMRAQMNALGQSTTLSTVESGGVATHQAMTRSSDESAEAISTTVLKKIRLADDKEPWISGKAEIYAIVTGVNPSRNEPTIDLVEMPYLDYDKQDYFPNQVMIQWPRYRWGAADLILMEQDSGTDYKELAKLLVKAAAEVLKLIPDPEMQAYAVIPQITGKIIDIIPNSLLVNDDDFVDVFYTLMQDTSYVDHPGASGNAVVTFEPLTINPTRP